MVLLWLDGAIRSLLVVHFCVHWQGVALVYWRVISPLSRPTCTCTFSRFFCLCTDGDGDTAIAYLLSSLYILSLVV